MPLYIPALIIVIVFYGLPKHLINRLQKIQNSVARIVTRTSRSSHITPVLKFLHWLPVQYRINFKLCCITHRALSLKEPHYLNSLLINRLNSHSLRSSSFNPLTLPFFNKNQMVFAHLPILYHFFGTIYLTLFVLHLHTYLFEKGELTTCKLKHVYYYYITHTHIMSICRLCTHRRYFCGTV